MNDAMNNLKHSPDRNSKSLSGPTLNQKLRRIARNVFTEIVNDQRGQVLPMVAIFMVGFLGMSAYVVDVGRVYVSYRQLQSSTNAAALAGAEVLPNSGAATTATAYSSATGGKNAFGDLATVTTTVTAKCLATLTNEGIPCVAPSSANAIQVSQTATVPMTFAALFGTKSISITATATAAMSGAITTPYNVAIIVDTTASMADQDTGSNCDSSRLTCALGGVQTLLSELDPCPANDATCSITSGVAANAVDQVSLFTFPNMVTTSTTTITITNSSGTTSSSTSTSTSTVANDYTCPTSNPSIEPYTFPSTTATSLTTMPYTPTATTTSKTTGTGINKTTTTTTTSITYNMTYQITPYLSDYRVSDTSSSLNTASWNVIAAGGKSGCNGVGDPGGESTYYAGAIYAAQASLLAQQAANPGSQNVIILITDGDAEATGTGSTPDMSVGSTSTTVATSGGTYPSWKNECAQAVTAAKAAAAAGTRVYAVAYGAESTGCSTDSPAITPCSTMESIASSPAYFYSDYAQSGSGVDSSCISSSDSTTNIKQIFTDIATSFTVPRLIPNGTT